MKRKIVLIVSLVAGLAAAVCTRLYLASKTSEVDRMKAAINRRYGTMEVLCFAVDLPAGTVLAKSDLGIKKVPALGMRGQALTVDNVTDVVGRKILLGHSKGDVVFWADIEGGNPAAEGLSASVKRNLRAISINCSGAASVSGMVKPNDRVDVIGTFDFDSDHGKKNFVTCTILQNVLVLATGNVTAKSPQSSLGVRQGYSTVTLEVTPREAEMLAFTEQIKGRLILSLRNRNDASYEKELPKVDFEKIRSTIEDLNLKRQQKLGGR
jgi:pilus assembly protein CpaB